MCTINKYIFFNLLSAEEVMATQKRPLTKLLFPLPPPGHEFQVGMLHLKNGQRIKTLQAFPQVGELPAVAGKMLTMQNKNMTNKNKTELN